jgi:hypothetical protein
MQALLGLPGDVQGLGRLAVLAAAQLDAAGEMQPVVPGGLDEQPAGVAGVGLGDLALAAVGSAGVYPTASALLRGGVVVSLFFGVSGCFFGFGGVFLVGGVFAGLAVFL